MLSGIMNARSFLPDLYTISFAPQVSYVIKELLFSLVSVSAISKCSHASMHFKLFALMSFMFKFCSEYESVTRVSAEIQLHEFVLESTNTLGNVLLR